MAGSVFGKIFRVSTFGESHGAGLGAVIDGVPAGLSLTEEDIQIFLDRRKPGVGKYATKRAESDLVEIVSGVFEGRTTGTPIMMLIRNKDQRSGDYSDIMDIYRPGHGDYTYDSKYGFRDYRGGGRASARETAARVCAGAVAIKALNELGISFLTYTESIGPVKVNSIDPAHISQNELNMPDLDAAKKAMEYLDGIREAGDSSGGSICCRIKGVPAGLGEPVFDKLDALFAGALMSIGAVKAVEIGEGIAASTLKGSENNDEFIIREGAVKKATNHSGGILGGISDGDEIVLRAHIKPTPSISRPQKTVNKSGKETDISIKGRHDPVVVARAVVVVEAMAAMVIFDALLSNMSSKMDNLKKIYGEDN